MKESIYVRELGSLREIRIPDLRQLTFFIGQSVSGKCVLMKAAAMMRSIFKRENVRHFLKRANISNISLPEGLPSFSPLGELLTASTEILYEVAIGSHKYQMICRNRKLILPEVIHEEDLSFLIVGYVSASSSLIPTLLQLNPAGNSELGSCENETLKLFAEAAQHIDECSLDFLHLNLRIRHSSSGKKSFSFVDQDLNECRIQDASSGILSSAVAMVILNLNAWPGVPGRNGFLQIRDGRLTQGSKM